MPNIVGCVKRLLPKKKEEDDEKKKKEEVTPSTDDSQPSTSGSYPYCESFDHLTSCENYDYLRQWGDEDLQLLLEDFEKTGARITKMLKELERKDLEAKRKTWLEDDLHSALRKNESTLSRIKLAESIRKKDLEGKKIE